MSFLVASWAYAQSAEGPLVINEYYAQKISPDGKWLYGVTESNEGVIINLQTTEYVPFNEMSLGNGNVFSLDGLAVGSTDDTNGQAVIINGINVVRQPELSKYWYSNINGITANGKLVVGAIGNEGSTGSIEDASQTYLPFIAEVDEYAECGNITVLPHPETDYSGRVPQYSSATWVSDDGKTVLGQLIDYSGMFIHPIMYHQNETGEWSYTLPAESLINPEHIELPEFPGEFDYSRQPDPLNYMTEEMQEQYVEDMEYWETDENGAYDEENYPGNNLDYYMTPEKYTEYVDAYIEFEDYVTKYNDEVNAYLEAFYMIVDTSVGFLQNGSAMNRAGTLAALTSAAYVETGALEPETVYSVYMYDIVAGKLNKLASKYKDIIASQVLDNGIVLGSTPNAVYPAAYVYVPGAEDFVPVEDYLMAGNPAAVDWMRENLVHNIMDVGGSEVDPYSAATRADTADGTPMITGFGVASDDFSVFAGGVPSYLYSDEVGYITYAFRNLSTSGLKTITASGAAEVKPLGNGILSVVGKVYDLSVIDLSGRTVFSEPNAEGTVETGLSHGIYIVTYTNSDGQRLSQKVNM